MAFDLRIYIKHYLELVRGKCCKPPWQNAIHAIHKLLQI